MSYGARLPGHGGITVRYLGVRPPNVATQAGDPVEFFVDARRKPWTWSVRRVGSGAATPSRRKTSARVRLHAPGRESGVYLMQVRTATHTTSVPFAVQSAKRHRVLVVLPVMTWQGRNSLDDDGDGLPNLLDRGVGAKLFRVYAGDGLPVGLRHARRAAAGVAGPRAATATTSRPTWRSPPAAARGWRTTAASSCPPTRAGCRAALQQRLRRYVRGGGARRLLRRRLAAPPGLAHRPRADGRPHAAGDDRRLRRRGCAR